MFSQISKKLTKISSIKLTAFSFLLFLFFMFVVLPGLASKAAELFAGLGSPDLLFFYSGEKLYEVASSYGELGRNAYIETRFQFDLVWPVVYTLFLVTSISWFCSRITNVQSKLRYCNLLPIVAVVFDLLENLSVSIVMYQFPAKTALFSNIASYSTTLKWIFVYASFLTLAISMVVFLWVSIKKRIIRNSR